MTNTLTASDLAALEALEREAAPGPWWWHNNAGGAEELRCEPTDEPHDGLILRIPMAEDGESQRWPNEADAALIVALRNAAPRLIAAARERDRLRGLVERALDHVQERGGSDDELADEMRKALETRVGG